MKTRNLETELRLKQKLITRGTGFPGNKEGRDGDFTIRFVTGRGMFFFYKWSNKWYSTRMSVYTPKTHQRNEPVILPKGRPPKIVGEATLDIDGKVFVRDTTSTKQQVLSVGSTGICDLTTFTGSSGIKFKRSTTATVAAGSNDDFMLENTSTSANAHTRITLKTNKQSADASDSYINYVYEHRGESPTWKGWCVGMDGSHATNKFVWNKFPGTAPAVVSTIPSDSAQTRLSLDGGGNLEAAGTVQGTKLRASSTAATTNDTDKFLCIGDGAGEDTYEVKYVTGDTLLGAMAALKDTTDTLTGTLTIDTNGTETTTSTVKGVHIDFDQTGIADSGQILTNIGLDLDMNSESVIHVGTVVHTGIDIDMVGSTDGSQIQTGISINTNGADYNTGLRINTSGTHIRLDAQADPITDYATFVVADTGDLIIATVGDGTTDSDLTLIPDGDLYLDPASRAVKIFTGDKLFFDGDSETTFIFEQSDDVLTFVTGGDYMLSLDEANDKIVFGASNWVAGTVSGATVTEFSAANSAYAGMILGFTVDGNDSADQTYNLTTSYAVFDSDLSVTFKTPPSEKVEIQATFYYQQGNSGNNVLATISNHATYASNSLHHDLQHERSVTAGAERGGQGIVTVSWYMIGIALEPIGSSQTIYFGAKCSSTTGTPNIKWGGSASGEYQNFVMRAIALPA